MYFLDFKNKPSNSKHLFYCVPIYAHHEFVGGARTGQQAQGIAETSPARYLLSLLVIQACALPLSYAQVSEPSECSLQGACGAWWPLWCAPSPITLLCIIFAQSDHLEKIKTGNIPSNDNFATKALLSSEVGTR